jgi:hypothetical protein
MAIFAPSPIADRISKALGLENCRSLKFSMEVGSVVAVVTEQYVSGDQLGRLACELETNNWVLVSKKEYESNRHWFPKVTSEPPPAPKSGGEAWLSPRDGTGRPPSPTRSGELSERED